MQAALTEYLRGVCPTYVGMNRMYYINTQGPNRMPHVCGDEPITVKPYGRQR